MSGSDERLNIAARAERWSASHFKTAVFGWLAFAVAVTVLGGAVGTKELADSETASGEAATAQKLLEDGDFVSPAGEQVLVQSRAVTTEDPAFRSVVRDATGRLSALEDVENVRSPFDLQAQGQESPDGHSALITFDVRGDADTAEDRIDPVLDAVAAVERANPDFVIAQFGEASAKRELSLTVDKDFQRAEVLSLPITLVILIFAFGALVAAGLPVLLAISAVLASTGVSALISHVVAASDATTSVILLIGMAVGVDYSLFYLRRERQERAAGHPPQEALARTAATSGQAVLISGATVFIAMAGMLLAGNKVFISIAIGAMVVVAMSMIGSLTVLPAMMAKLGDRVDRGRVPFLGRASGTTGGGVWGRVLTPVLRYPAASVAVAGGMLVALAVPALNLHTKVPSFTDLPPELALVDSYERIQDAFPGAQTPALVVVRAQNVESRPVQRAIVDLQLNAFATGQMHQPMQTDINRNKTVATISVPLQGTGDDDASKQALRTLRDRVIPQTVGRVDGTRVAVTGITAGSEDFNNAMKSSVPLVFAFVLGLAFLLLLATFRSIVIPIKAIVLNLLSVGAAYGVLVLVFQHTWAEDALGFKSNGGIASWLPLFLFVLLFGLSMDYHVFILSRVKELVDRGMRTQDAVAQGIRDTAGTVTGAAIVMIAVFSIFATLSSLDLKQMGVGLAVAVLIDATIVRAVLLPASMKLLGEWNWYLPRWLEWMPSLAAEGQLDAHAAPAVPTAASELSIRQTPRPGGIRVSLSGELSLASVGHLRETLERIEATRPLLLVIDLRELAFLDSTGIRELLAARRRAREEDRRLVLTTGPGPVDRILKVAGMKDVFDMVEGSAAGPVE